MTYKDFNVGSSIDLNRLQTERDLADCVSIAIDVLMESVHTVERLNEWHPDTLKLNAHGISLIEGLHPDSGRSIEYKAIPQALATIMQTKLIQVASTSH